MATKYVRLFFFFFFFYFFFLFSVFALMNQHASKFRIIAGTNSFRIVEDTVFLMYLSPAGCPVITVTNVVLRYTQTR